MHYNIEMEENTADSSYLTCLIGEDDDLFRVRVLRGRAEVTGTLGSSHGSCQGMVHRGLIAALLDTAMGKAFTSLGLPGMTVLFKVDYLAEPARGETVNVLAEVVREDLSRVVAEGSVSCGSSPGPVALGQAVFLKSAGALNNDDVT